MKYSLHLINVPSNIFPDHTMNIGSAMAKPTTTTTTNNQFKLDEESHVEGHDDSNRASDEAAQTAYYGRLKTSAAQSHTIRLLPADFVSSPIMKDFSYPTTAETSTTLLSETDKTVHSDMTSATTLKETKSDIFPSLKTFSSSTDTGSDEIPFVDAGIEDSDDDKDVQIIKVGSAKKPTIKEDVVSNHDSLAGSSTASDDGSVYYSLYSDTISETSKQPEPQPQPQHQVHYSRSVSVSHMGANYHNNNNNRYSTFFDSGYGNPTSSSASASYVNNNGFNQNTPYSSILSRKAIPPCKRSMSMLVPGTKFDQGIFKMMEQREELIIQNMLCLYKQNRLHDKRVKNNMNMNKHGHFLEEGSTGVPPVTSVFKDDYDDEREYLLKKAKELSGGHRARLARGGFNHGDSVGGGNGDGDGYVAAGSARVGDRDYGAEINEVNEETQPLFF
ncbi:unnamed protein product [Ambrosiozyma monospora]|uniref:Unnamed protein product n=1 Tax=Ambrosiozyma monospora TaxID=43982 RepID=A0ACB5STJ6_AMBMO|nr:unnamed protein product [Ambrosiozyma monospora]